MGETLAWYDEAVKKGRETYPDMEDHYCPDCGYELVRGSVAYEEGFHFDGCPTVTE